MYVIYISIKNIKNLGVIKLYKFKTWNKYSKILINVNKLLNVGDRYETDSLCPLFLRVLQFFFVKIFLMKMLTWRGKVLKWTPKVEKKMSKIVLPSVITTTTLQWLWNKFMTPAKTELLYFLKLLPLPWKTKSQEQRENQGVRPVVLF